MVSTIKIFINNKGVKKYFNNTLWLFIEKIFRMTLGFTVGIWVARYLGPQQFGQLSFAQSFITIFSIFASLGLDNIVIRELIKNSQKRDIILGTAFTIKLLSSMITIILVYYLVVFLYDDKTTQQLLKIIAFSLLFTSFQVIDFYYQANVMAKVTTLSNLLTILISSVLKIFFILIHASIIYFAMVILIESIILSISYLCFYQKSHLSIKMWSFDSEVFKKLLIDSWPFIFSSFAVIIYMKIDVIMIKEMLNDNAVGQYSVAIRLSEVWNFIPVTIAASLFPAIFNVKENSHLYENRLRQLYTLLAWIAISLSVALSYFSPNIIPLLFGNKYTEAIPVLQIHIWSTIFIFLLVASGKWLVSENLGKYALYRNLSGAVVNILLNFILIPKFGIVGAAYATLISYAVAGLFYDMINNKLRKQFFLKLQSIALYAYWPNRTKGRM